MGAEIGKDLRRLVRRRFDVGVELLDVAEARAPGDAQAAHAVVEADAIVGRRRVPGGGVAHVGLADDAEHQRGVGDGAGERTLMRQHGEGRGRIGRHAAVARLDAEHAGEGRRELRIEPAPSVPRCSRPRLSSAAAAAPPEEPPVVRVRFQGLRVMPVSGEWQAPIQPNSGVRGLAEDDGTLFVEARHRGRIVRRRCRGCGERALARRLSLDVDDVLDGRRQAVDEAFRFALGPARFRSARGGERAAPYRPARRH